MANQHTNPVLKKLRALLRYRSVLMILLLAVVASFFLLQRMSSNLEAAMTTQRSVQRMNVAQDFARLIHAAQRERSLAMQDVVPAKIYTREEYWQTVQKDTEHTLAQVLSKQDMLQQFFANGAYSQTARKTLDHAHEKLLSIRAQTSANGGLELSVALAYSNFIGDWVVLLEELLDNSKIESTRPLTAFLLLVQIKEQEEKQRTLLSLAMAQNTVDSNDLRETLSAITSQDWMLKIFQVLAPKKTQQPADLAIEEVASHEQRQRLREALGEKIIADPGQLHEDDTHKHLNALLDSRNEAMQIAVETYSSQLRDDLLHDEERLSAGVREDAVVTALVWAFFLLTLLWRNSKATQERMHNLIANVDGVVWEADLEDDSYSFVSARAESLLGYPLTAWCQSGFITSLVYPEKMTEENGFHRRYESTAERWHCDYRLRKSDGTLIWLREMGTRVGRSKNDRRALGILVDISAAKAAEEQLRFAAETIENMVEGVVVTDTDGIIMMVNAAYCRITGYLREELLGTNIRLLKSGRQSTEFYGEMWVALTQKGSWQGELWNRRKNGEIYPERISITAVRDNHGQLANYLSVTADLSEHYRHEALVETLSRRDSLTGLCNWDEWRERLNAAINAATEQHHNLTVLFLNMDRFKNVVEALGHKVAERLLRAIAERLQQTIGNADNAARRSADEFFILLPGCDKTNAVIMTKALLHSLREPFWCDGREFLLTASIGITVYPEHGGQPEDLLRQVEMALRWAKHEGRDNAQFPPTTGGLASLESLEIEVALRRALGNRELVVYYQPKVNLFTGTITGVEALVRWKHPQRGLVSPAVFIPLAEETGLIVDIGAWVLATACEEAARWRTVGPRELTVAVNVSALQLRDPYFLDQLQRVLNKTGLPPQLLELEITESMLMDAPEKAAELLRQISALDVRISLDDFGTGYSSLSYLKQLPLNTLKIDQSFVRSLLTSHNDAALVEAIAAMAQSLDLSVVAEGVECVEQLDFLRKLHCQYIQGFYFGRPMPHEDLERLLLKDLIATPQNFDYHI